MLSPRCHVHDAARDLRWSRGTWLLAVSSRSRSLSLGTPDPPNRLSRKAPAEPASLDLGHVADKSKQGEIGGRDRRRLELSVGEPLTLPGQGGSLILKEARQSRSLIPVPRRVGSLPKHGSIIVTSADVVRGARGEWSGPRRRRRSRRIHTRS